MTDAEITELFGDNLIASYSRAQAIDDGQLVDLSEKAKGYFGGLPVACTASVWHYIQVPQGVRC